MLSPAICIMAALGTAASLVAAEPFEVSLAYSPAADLSEHYRALVRGATQWYRGDGSESFVVERTYIHGYLGRPGTFETQHIIGDPLVDEYYFFRTSSAGTRELLSEAQFLLDPFPAKPLTLRSSP
jgi:hypothetical protein